MSDVDSYLTPQQLEVDGHTINYVRVGEGSHTVLLMPGALGCATTDFKLQLTHFDRSKFTIVAWDPPGYGLSRPPDRTWPLKFYQRDAEMAFKLMEALSVPLFSMLGWSDGGTTALCLACTYPQVVRKLVIWGASSFFTPEVVQMCSQASADDLADCIGRPRTVFIDLYGEEYYYQLWRDEAVALQQYSDIHNGNICDDQLGTIPCQTLVVHGDKDAFVTVSHAEHLNKQIQNSKLVRFPTGEHHLHIHMHQEFNSLVQQFLAQP